jgi:hypothetical protein
MKSAKRVNKRAKVVRLEQVAAKSRFVRLFLATAYDILLLSPE